MDSEIKATVDRLDQRIAKLTKIRELLLEEFGEAAQPQQPLLVLDTTKPVTSTGNNGTALMVKTRKQTIAEFLRSQGPARRKDIADRTGVPSGTVSYELNDKETFERLDDGRYTVRG
jgi:hypothetical protein